MCFSSNDPPPPVTPPTPPPPPATLEQPAPDVASPKPADDAKAKAGGTKQYRTSLSIGTPSAATTPNNTGLGISM